MRHPLPQLSGIAKHTQYIACLCEYIRGIQRKWPESEWRNYEIMIQWAYWTSEPLGNLTPRFSNCTSVRPVCAPLVGLLPYLVLAVGVVSTTSASEETYNTTNLAIPGVPKLCRDYRPS